VSTVQRALIVDYDRDFAEDLAAILEVDYAVEIWERQTPPPESHWRAFDAVILCADAAHELLHQAVVAPVRGGADWVREAHTSAFIVLGALAHHEPLPPGVKLHLMPRYPRPRALLQCLTAPRNPLRPPPRD